MSEQYPGGFINKTAPTLNPALGNAAPGVWNMTQVQQAIKAGTWPAYDPYSKYTTLLLHGDGTNGGQNNTFLDSSTNNFTITRNGNTTQGSFSPYGSNWSNYFNGTDAYLSVSAQTALSFDGDFTVEAWVNVQTVATSHFPIIDARVTANDNPWALYVINNGATVNLYALYRSGSGMVSTSTVPLNSWVHVAMTRSGSTVRMFINGVTDATTGTNASTMSAGTTQFIGRSKAGEYGTGYISSLRVVKGTALYTSNFTPSTTPLTAVSGTSLLTCQSNRFIDNSSNAFELTVNGTPSVQRFSPFAPSAAYSTATIGGSGYFDGTGDYLTVGNVLNLGSGDLTIEFWMNSAKQASLNTNSYTIVSGEYSGSGVLWSVGVFDYGGFHGLTFSYGQYGYYTVGITTNNYLGSNVWQHIAITRASGTWRIFVNGVSQTLTTYNEGGTWDANFNFTNNTATSRNIGATTTPSTYFKGYMNGFRIVVGTAVYTTAFTPPTAPLTAITNTSLLLNFTNGAIFDNAMMNDLETVGNAQISTSVVKYGTGSIYIPGGGANAFIPSSPNLDMGTGAFTVECWVNSTSIAAAYPTFISSVTGWSAGSSGHRFNNSGAANKFTFHLNGAGDPFLTSGNTFSFGVWYHYALTRSGDTWRMFINGNLEASGTYSAAFNQALGGIRLGYAQWDGANGYYNGYIDDLRITKGYARYTANFTPPTSQLQDQ